MRPLLPLLAVLLLPLPTLAAEWTSYGTSDAGDNFVYDKQSVFRQSDGHVRVWTESNNTISLMICITDCGEKSGDEKNKCLSAKQKICPNGKPFGSTPSLLYEFSCSGQFRTLSDEKIGEWKYIKPDMYIAALERIVCK